MPTAKKTTKPAKVKIQPLADRVLVKPLSKEEINKRSNSGIILPETLDKERPEQGLVLAVGPGKTSESGEIIPLSVKVGDRVLFSKFGPDEISIDNEDYLIISESSILAVVG